MRLAISHGDRVHQINTHVISAFDLWLQKDQTQRGLWPSTIALSMDYYMACNGTRLLARA